MPAQLYLVAPTDADSVGFAAALKDVLGAASVSALLLPRGRRAENAYKAVVKSVAPLAQDAGCAVLIEGEPGLVKLLGADGLHVAGSAKAVKEAIGQLKPDLIVGAGPAATRHDAMTLGELGVDYLVFGNFDAPLTAETADMAQWWAETMEIPAVLCDGTATPDSIDPLGCEFVALSANVWAAPEGAAATIAAFARRLETF